MKRFLVEDDAIDNPKLMLLEPDAFRFWFLCMCVANRSAKRGDLPDVKTIAFRTRMGVVECERLLSVLVEVKLIDRRKGGTMAIHDWDDYQPTGRDWASIKAAQREKKKAEKTSDDQVETGDVHNVHVDMSTMSTRTSPPSPQPCPRIKKGRTIVLTEKEKEFCSSINQSKTEEGAIEDESEDTLETCTALAGKLLGKAMADTVARSSEGIDEGLFGRWDCLAAAIRQTHNRISSGNPEAIRDGWAYVWKIAVSYAVNGLPAEMIVLTPNPRASPAAPKAVMTPEQRSRLLDL